MARTAKLKTMDPQRPEEIYKFARQMEEALGLLLMDDDGSFFSTKYFFAGWCTSLIHKQT